MRMIPLEVRRLVGQSEHHVEELRKQHPAVDQLRKLLQENRAGMHKGIYSVCSANHLVLEAALSQSMHDRSPLLVEATCNQVNQEGGYTGQTPAGFRDYVHSIGAEMHFPLELLVLGGDHLGPNPWRAQSAEVAMEKACAMVAAYAEAGFSKIHLDASMPCGDDPAVLAQAVIAERAARLCEAAESAVCGRAGHLIYVIGTEVPTPGGAVDEMEIEVTTAASLQVTLDVHLEAFERRRLLPAWERVVAVVVQPGVEFSDETVADYKPEKAAELSSFILKQENIVFEAHSTDYQSERALAQLVRDHFGILKVGPELTFVMREAVFGLAQVEEEWIPEGRRSNLRAIIERVMLEHPEHWKSYYRGDGEAARVARAFSLSDRIRYYWPNADVSTALTHLLENLQTFPAPLPLIGQYLPHQAEAIRRGTIANELHAMIRHKIQGTLSRYARSCGLIPQE